MWSATTAPDGDPPAFALVSLGVEPPAGIEPATPSLPFVWSLTHKESAQANVTRVTVSDRRTPPETAPYGTQMA
jgi:hypothetical protein